MKYIDNKTFDIIEEDFFEVDDDIAQTISILNKKGYKTKYSCAGHVEQKCYKVTVKKEKLEKFKDTGTIGLVDDNYFEFFTDCDYTATYILFDKIYPFDNIPQGFEMEETEDKRTYIGKSICYYLEKDKLNDPEYMRKEIKQANENLLIWAQNLPTLRL